MKHEVNRRFWTECLIHGDLFNILWDEEVEYYGRVPEEGDDEQQD